MLVSEVMDSSAALLNDVNRDIFSYAAQLPYFKIAFKKTLLLLAANNISTFKEESAIITLPANTTSITPITVPPLPSDYFSPIKLEERPSGTTQLFQEMRLTEWEPEDTPGDTLGRWTIRSSQIKLLGATQSVDLKISYFTQPVITSENSAVAEATLEMLLAYHNAALCARYTGENYQRYNDLMREYSILEANYLSVHGNKNQAFPTRRPGYRETYRSGPQWQ